MERKLNIHDVIMFPAYLLHSVAAPAVNGTPTIELESFELKPKSCIAYVYPVVTDSVCNLPLHQATKGVFSISARL